MTVELNPALDELAHVFGYQSAIDFTRIQLEQLAAQKLAYFQSRTDLYEQKYGCLLDEFTQRVANQQDNSLKRFGIIEKEDDLMDWEDSIHSVRFYEQQLRTLENGGATA